MIARLLFVSLCVCMVAAQQFTQGVRNCRNNHVDRFNECLMSEIKKIQPLLGDGECLKEEIKKIQSPLKDGLSEFNLPPLEPFVLQNIEFRQSFPPVSIEATFRNVLVYGFSAFDLKYLNLDFSTTRKQSLGMTIPSLTMRGQYKIGGNVFLLPIEGNGDIFTVIDGVIAEGSGDIRHEGGKVVMRNINIGFKIRSMKIRMENLFQGNQILSDIIHHFINENSDLVLDAIRPGVTAQLNTFFEEIFDTIFSVLPSDTLTELPRNQQDLVTETTI